MFPVSECVRIYSHPTFIRAFAFLNPLHIGIEILARNSSPCEQLFLSIELTHERALKTAKWTLTELSVWRWNLSYSPV